MDWPPPPDEEQDNTPTLADLLAGVVAQDASTDGTNAALDDPRGYGVDYGGTPSPNDAGGTGVDSYGPPAPESQGPPDWMAGMLGNNADAPGDYGAGKPWDAVGPSYQRQDEATPEMPFPGTNTMLATPFGGVSAPTWLPFQAAKPVRPTEDEQQRVQQGQAPVQSWGDLVGGVTRFLQKQGESLPGNVGSQMMPEEQGAARMRLGEIGGPMGEDLANDLPKTTIWEDIARLATGHGGQIARAASEIAPAAERAAPAGETAAQDAAPASRFFHGTGSDFQTPTADKFDPNGLYGPGYYLTDSPTVAGSYTERNTRSSAKFIVPQLEKQIARNEEALRSPGLAPDVAERYRRNIADLLSEIDVESPGRPNMRAVDVPHDLNLLDAEAAATPDDVAHIQGSLAQFDATHGTDAATRFAGALGTDPTNHGLYEALSNALDLTGVDGRTGANKALAAMGYDGVRYAGGQRVPMTDAAGAPIEHTALAVFPESLQKLRNAISGRPGGIVDQGILDPQTTDLAARGLGALGGAAAAQTGTDENTTWQERLARGVIGAEAGTRLGAAIGGRSGASGLLRAADDGIVDAHGRPIGQAPESQLGGLLDANGAPLRAGVTDADWAALGGVDPAERRLADARGRLIENPGATAPPGGTPPVAPPNPDARVGGTPVGPSPLQQHLATADALTRDLGLGVLANPASVAAIAVKNSLELPTRLMTGVLGSLYHRAPQEIGPQVQAFGSAMRQALPRFWHGMTAALEEMGPRAGYEGIETRHDTPVIGGLANVSRNAVRPHIGITDATSLAGADMETARRVQREATQRGLAGDARAQWVADTTAEVRRAQATLLGDKSPGSVMGRLPESAGDGISPVAEAIAREAIAAGQRLSYTEPLGPVAKAFQNVVHAIPVLGQVAAPYTKIPSNVAARALETTPLGVVGTLMDVARGAYNGAERPAGVSPLNERVVRNMIGAGAVVTGYVASQAGVVTGDRPDPTVDPKATALFDQRAVPANSVLIAGHSVPLAIFGTAGLGLKMGAELDAAQREGRTVPAAALSLIAQWVDETPARGTLALGKAVAEGVHAYDQGGLSAALATDPAQTQIESQVERWLPGAGLLRGAANALDPSERQVNGPLQAAESVVPGLRNTLPPRLDQTGRERPNPRFALGALNPVAARQETENPVLRLLDSNGVTVSSGKPPEEHAPGEGWTPAQLDLYHRRLGALVESNVTATVGSAERVRQVMDRPGTPAAKQALEAAVARAKQQLYADTNLTAQLDSTSPKRLQELATKYAAAPASKREFVVTSNIKEFGDYHAWAKAHGFQGNIADPRVLARYVALRPQ